MFMEAVNQLAETMNSLKEVITEKEKKEAAYSLTGTADSEKLEEIDKHSKE